MSQIDELLQLLQVVTDEIAHAREITEGGINRLSVATTAMMGARELTETMLGTARHLGLGPRIEALGRVAEECDKMLGQLGVSAQAGQAALASHEASADIVDEAVRAVYAANQ